jgi:citrate synthase
VPCQQKKDPKSTAASERRLFRAAGDPADATTYVKNRRAAGRVPGWTVQCLGQLQNNILTRPPTLYDGPPPRDHIPLERR